MTVETGAVVDRVPAEAFRLSESIAVHEGALADDGTVLLHLIRPCVGRGRGRHVYEANMLREHAHIFGDQKNDGGEIVRPGWKMYVDHQSPDARKRAGGLPRSVRDLGGRVEESWWDETVPAGGRFEQGAVVGRVRPVGIVKALIEEDPSIVEASLSATATGVKPAQREGARAWMVEGIDERGSVDWVSEAGAGGRVVSLMESVYEHPEEVELESMSDVQLLDHLRRERPHLVEALAPVPAVTPLHVTTTVETGEPEGEPEVDEGINTDDEPEEADMSFSPDELREALAQDEGFQDYVDGLVEARVDATVVDKLATERELIRAEALAEATRRDQLREMRDEAHRLIDESKLPPKWTAQLKTEYELSEGVPTSKLDQLDEVDEDDRIVKTAEESLREAINADIRRQRELLAEVAPTRVRGQGPTRATDVTEGDEQPQPKGDKSFWEQHLEESGVSDAAKAFAYSIED